VSGAALVVAGGLVLRAAALVLLLASLRLFRRAVELGLDPLHLPWLGLLAVLTGLFKGRRVMRPVLAANVAWLRARDVVPAWRLFPAWLLALITTMVTLAALLKHLAAGHAPGLALMGSLDLAVATALVLAAPAHGPAWPRRAPRH